MSTYLDLPFTDSLVELLTLPRVSTWLDLQLWCHAKRLQIQLSWDLGFFENSDLLKLPSFSSKVFLKLLSGAQPFFTLHSYFRQENIDLMQGVILCMIVREWIVRAFKFVFHLNSFYSSRFLDLLLVSPMCSVRTCSSGFLCLCPLLGQTFCLDDSLSRRNFPVLGVWSCDLLIPSLLENK